MHVGPGGAGNFVKMVHNGIEYGDMQLISEAYDILRTVGGFNNDELAETFTLWNKVPLVFKHMPGLVDMVSLGGIAQAAQCCLWQSMSKQGQMHISCYRVTWIAS
jgi:6-phosphogluconate dehydrogenase (decarboxylating)